MNGPCRHFLAVGVVALVSCFGLHRTTSAQPIFAAWNPIYADGDWEWGPVFIPNAWLLVPTDPTGSVAPIPGTSPDNTGSYLYFVTIGVDSNLNLSTTKTITGLSVHSDAALLINAGSLVVQATTANAAKIEINDLGTLFSTSFENSALGVVEITTGSQLIVPSVLDNSGEILGQVGALMTAGSISNQSSGLIEIGTGGMTIFSGVINNEGEIRLDQAGSELLVGLTSMTLTGGGRLVLDHSSASVVSPLTVNNLGDHTIRGKGSVVVPLLTNEATIRADEAGDVLDLLTTDFSNDGDLFALGASRLNLTTSSASNTGLWESSGMSRLDVEASSIDNHGTNPTPNLPPGEALHQGTGIRAIDQSIVKLADAAIDNNGGLIEARDNSIVQFQEVNLSGGLLHADSTSILHVTDVQSYMRDITLNGHLRVDTGGYLNFDHVIDNRDGVITISAGGHLDFDSFNVATLIGGVMDGPGTVSKEYFNHLTLDATSGMHFQDFTMTVNPGGFLKLIGHLTNDATIRLRHDQLQVATTPFLIQGDGLIDGGGRLLFGPGTIKNLVEPVAPGDSLTNAFTHTIANDGPGSWGEIRINLTNHGTVDANGGTMFVTSANVRNDGVMRSSNSGYLDIGNHGGVGNVLDNTDGVVEAVSGGNTRLSNLLVIDGTLAGNSVIDVGGATLQSTEMHITGHVRVASQQIVTLDGTFTNDGSIESHSNEGFNSRTFIKGNTTLGGTGQFIFSSIHENLIFPIDGTSVLTNAADHTIKTLADSEGFIYVKLINHGTVTADDGFLHLDHASDINDGFLQAQNGGQMRLGIENAPATLDNVDGIVRAGAGSEVLLRNLHVIGGAIDGPGNVFPQGNVLLDGSGPGGIYLNTNIRQPGAALSVSGDVTNDGVIRMSGDQFSTPLIFSGEVDLDGDGEIRIDGAINNLLIPASAASRLIHHEDHTITTAGAGTHGAIDLVFTNHGLIQADGGVLQIRTSNNVNNALIQAINGGVLRIESNTIALDNTNGRLHIGAGSTVQMHDATIVGGTIDGDGTLYPLRFSGFVPTLDGTASPVTLNADTYLGSGGQFSLKGQIVHNATISLNDPHLGSSSSVLIPQGVVSLTGTGSIELSGPYENGFVPYDSNPIHRLVQGEDHSIRVLNGTNHTIDANFTNHGLIEVDTGMLHIRAADAANDGMIRAINGGMLWLRAFRPAVIDNAGGGVIEADATSQVIVEGHIIKGGHLSGAGSFYIQGGATYDGRAPSGPVTIDAYSTAGWGSRLVFQGDIVNNATFNIIDPDFAGPAAAIVADGAVNLIGTGMIRMVSSDGTGNFFAGNPGATLHVGPDQLITAAAGVNNFLNLDMTLEGTLGADSGVFQIQQPITNNGTIRATGGSFQQFHFPTPGTGGWLADGGSLYFHPGMHPSTAGPITLRNGGVIYYNNLSATGSDLSVDATSILSVNASQVRLTGDFDFATSDEAYWSWTSGSILHMNGGVGAPEEEFSDWASLEIGGFDIGTNPPAHVGHPDGFVLTNFYLPNLTIGAGAHVYLADLLNNGHRGGPFGASEALYVGSLTFTDPSARLNLNGLHIYYLTLTGSPTQIIDSPVPEPTGTALLLLAILRRGIVRTIRR